MRYASSHRAQALKRRATVLLEVGKYDEALKDAEALAADASDLSLQIVRTLLLSAATPFRTIAENTAPLFRAIALAPHLVRR